MNITREVHISLASGDFTDKAGFFIRTASDGIIKYLPVDAYSEQYGYDDTQAITKTVSASPYFIDPVVCCKIFQLITSPDTDIYVGYGV